jgi:hypothetical protein
LPFTIADAVTVKLDELVTVPPGPLTEIGPEAAAAGTVAVICESELTVKLDAATPLKATPVAPVKPLPLIVTVVPTVPLVGEKPEIAGAGCAVTVNAFALAPAPALVVTAMTPLVAFAGTVAVICVAELTVKLAAVPLKVTELAPVSPVPVIVTPVPGGPDVGEKEVTVGAACGAVLQPGRVNEPIRVFQSSWASEVGWTS